jgi:glycerol kinase
MHRPADPSKGFLQGLDRYRSRTGLPIANYFSACKLLYLLNTVEGLREAAERGDAIFGTVDSWLLFCLTAGRVHANDVSNASRTNLMNLSSLSWDVDLLADLGVPAAMLPRILPSVGHLVT